MQKFALHMIISGGQTGVDRAALEFAQHSGIHCSGWCPQGRRAEDGVIPAHYMMIEASSPAYQHRTRLNVRDSDATLILTDRSHSRGTDLTIKCCQLMNKPFMVASFAFIKSTADLADSLDLTNTTNQTISATTTDTPGPTVLTSSTEPTIKAEPTAPTDTISSTISTSSTGPTGPAVLMYLATQTSLAGLTIQANPLEPANHANPSNHLNQICLAILKWLLRFKPTVLNIAGPRASECPAAAEQVPAILAKVICPAEGSPPPWPPKRPFTPKLPLL